MAWAFVRPVDTSLLGQRPLLDLGTGDGSTVAALTQGGMIVGVDRDRTLLRPGGVNALADVLPFRSGSIGTVLAADVFHHLDDDALTRSLGEIARVLRKGGRLVAWWYEHTTDTSPDAPRYARALDPLMDVARAKELTPEAIELQTAVTDSATVGFAATH